MGDTRPGRVYAELLVEVVRPTGSVVVMTYRDFADAVHHGTIELTELAQACTFVRTPEGSRLYLMGGAERLLVEVIQRKAARMAQAPQVAS